MRRRDFITLFGGAAALPLGAGAQQAGATRRIGALIAFAKDDPEARSAWQDFGRASQNADGLRGAIST